MGLILQNIFPALATIWLRQCVAVTHHGPVHGTISHSTVPLPRSHPHTARHTLGSYHHLIKGPTVAATQALTYIRVIIMRSEMKC